jgi:Tfp pilus assembly protein PilF
VPLNQVHRVLEAAIGYFDLGMPQDALHELDELSVADQQTIEVLELRAFLLQHLRQWRLAAETYAKICQRPDVSVDRFLAWGCCLYEVRDVQGCRDALRSVPKEKVQSHALWHFHLACYEALLKNSEEARVLALRALHLDPSLRAMAHQNSNLAPLFQT